METTDNVCAELIKLYASKGVVIEKEQAEALPLHLNCPDRNICWQGCDTSNECDWNKTQLPYIESSYLISPKRLTVLGINLNHDGGLNALETLISEVPKELLSGKKKINFKALGSLPPPNIPCH